MDLNPLDAYVLNSNIHRTQEHLAKYKPGGYLPVYTGDEFQGRKYKFRIIDKLGHGGFSTVCTNTSVWLSLKIMTAQATKTTTILQTLENTPRIVSPYQFRDLEGGPEYLQPTTVLKITSQMLEALRAIHAAGLVHGDLSSANGAFTMHQLNGVPDQSVREYLGPKTDWEGFDGEDDEDICLLDFGEPFRGSRPQPETINQPSNMRVSEIMFKDQVHFYRIDHRTDLSSLFIKPLTFLLTTVNTTSGSSGPAESFRELQGECSRLRPLEQVIRGLMQFRPTDRTEASAALVEVKSIMTQGH
ncbi:hypothetical protein B0T24DRAFT_594835 [Lasiosphaeria ovina]|uniref:Protein kinase domain-containing protein n=1 Tax=Lasiosphaeria ovina TaxID=92902 RepID=A0AAE0K6A3_9PEZI|nr:hypothetical protein B0T24DRAFT_594835 [Lasiosphaeria ovina]